ncbi:hypothetical protein H4Q26_018239 [Puccinia striiformis f. sp. tritici PST-130]|nr:hypothetical protein H4Q26_018239 [Puccinia striiformis f. sp. tritici PST-130]
MKLPPCQGLTLGTIEAENVGQVAREQIKDVFSKRFRILTTAADHPLLETSTFSQNVCVKFTIILALLSVAATALCAPLPSSTGVSPSLNAGSDEAQPVLDTFRFKKRGQDTDNDDPLLTPFLNTYRPVEKRSKVSDAAGYVPHSTSKLISNGHLALRHVRAAVEAGSGIPNLIADVQKLQKDVQNIVTQLKAAGLFPGSKKDPATQGLKQGDTAVAIEAPDTISEAEPADNDSAITPDSDSTTTETEAVPSPESSAPTDLSQADN